MIEVKPFACSVPSIKQSYNSYVHTGQFVFNEPRLHFQTSRRAISATGLFTSRVARLTIILPRLTEINPCLQIWTRSWNK
jgi:hypothetical protein